MPRNVLKPILLKMHCKLPWRIIREFQKMVSKNTFQKLGVEVSMAADGKVRLSAPFPVCPSEIPGFSGPRLSSWPPSLLFVAPKTVYKSAPFAGYVSISSSFNQVFHFSIQKSCSTWRILYKKNTPFTSNLVSPPWTPPRNPRRSKKMTANFQLEPNWW